MNESNNTETPFL